MKPKLLDLFCKAGGCSVGYYRAGFEVTGVDIDFQPNYPFTFIQADFREVNLSNYDVIAASPPCQAYSVATIPARKLGKEYPDLILETRELLKKSGKVYIIENVTKRILINPIMICGSYFDLGVKRHRWFESNIPLVGTKCEHKGTVKDGTYTTVAGHGLRGKQSASVKNWSEAMYINWMSTTKELSQAIPPDYTQYLGRQVIAWLQN